MGMRENYYDVIGDERFMTARASRASRLFYADPLLSRGGPAAID